ncbi:MAG: 3'(2'),5'-bisphosphate nucleotidase CysQ [Labilithrix sp.]|nr:3'(2'),5'-bisphosphate nucleotidase CysQ [Labilithrix sp.]
MIDRAEVLEKLVVAAREAAEVVMRIYGEDDVGAEMKAPGDPVTRADKEANALILARLARDLPGIPVVAEESDPVAFAGFEGERAALFVDPVDGTRDFIAKNGEFCVMIGLAEEGRATVGVVLCPTFQNRRRTYVAAEGLGAFVLDEDGARTPLRASSATDLSACRCAVSRFHRSKSVDTRLQTLGCKELVPIGSSGIKGVMIASGEIEIYAHPSRGLVKLWDACAPDAIVRAAGGVYTDGTGKPFDYRSAVAQGEGTLAASPRLHAEALRRFAS